MKEYVFHHPLMGRLRVYVHGKEWFVEGRACALKLGYINWRRALVKSDALCVYGNKPIASDVWIDGRDVWKLAFYARERGRGLAAKMLYDWVYEHIMSKVTKEASKNA